MLPAANAAEPGSSKNSIVSPMTGRTPRPSCHGTDARRAPRTGPGANALHRYRSGRPWLARPRWHCVALTGAFWRGLHPGIHNLETGYVLATEKEAHSRAEHTERTRHDAPARRWRLRCWTICDEGAKGKNWDGKRTCAESNDHQATNAGAQHIIPIYNIRPFTDFDDAPIPVITRRRIGSSCQEWA